MKAALIGLGRMGLRHLEVLNSMGIQTIGAADMFEASRKAAIEAGLDESALYEDSKTMLEAVKAELVVIATTAPAHENLTLCAIENGAKYILCEKPMGVSIEECEAMIKSAKDNGVKLAINHQMRFMEQYTIPKAMMNDEGFGELASVTVTAGNFGIAMNGSHYIEMFRFITGEDVETAQGWLSDDPLPNPRGPQFADRAGQMRLVTKSGKRFYMDCGPDQGHGMHVTYMGHGGRIDIDELSGDLRAVIRQSEHKDAPTTRYGMPYNVIEQKIAPADATSPTKSVLEALLKGENYPNGEDGLNAVRALMAVTHSDENGNKIVNINDAAIDKVRKLPWA